MYSTLKIVCVINVLNPISFVSKMVRDIDQIVFKVDHSTDQIEHFDIPLALS